MPTALTKYRATFPDGTVITRKSNHNYTHAWRVLLTTPRLAGPLQTPKPVAGFAHSLLAAQKSAAAMWTRWNGVGYEVVPVEVL